MKIERKISDVRPIQDRTTVVVTVPLDEQAEDLWSKDIRVFVHRGHVSLERHDFPAKYALQVALAITQAAEEYAAWERDGFREKVDE